MTQEELIQDVKKISDIIAQLKVYSLAKTITEFYDFIPDKDQESASDIVQELKENGIETTEEIVNQIQTNNTGWGYDYVADKVYELISQL